MQLFKDTKVGNYTHMVRGKLIPKVNSPTFAFLKRKRETNPTFTARQRKNILSARTTPPPPHCCGKNISLYLHCVRINAGLLHVWRPSSKQPFTLTLLICDVWFWLQLKVWIQKICKCNHAAYVYSNTPIITFPFPARHEGKDDW